MIYFRPHHFLCTLGFQGKGYSLGFIKNYIKIKEKLTNYPETEITVIARDDDICSACPNILEEGLCKYQEKIDLIDSAHFNALGLSNRQILTWSSSKRLIKEKINVETFHNICSSCEWKKYGVCEEALTELINS